MWKVGDDIVFKTKENNENIIIGRVVMYHNVMKILDGGTVYDFEEVNLQ